MSTTLGTELRNMRIRAGFRTQVNLADYLANHDLNYSDKTISAWENGTRKPERDVLVKLLSLLAAKGAVRSRDYINELLLQIDAEPLQLDEIQTYFPELQPVIEHLPPRDYTLLIGREDLLAHLLSQLRDSNAKPIISIAGLGGIGKTAIAYEVAYRLLLEGDFKQLVWVTAKSEEFVSTVIRPKQNQIISLPMVLGEVARQLGIDRPAADMLTLKAVIREQLRRASCLLVMDNLESLEAAHEMVKILYELVSPETVSRVLVTSRERLADISFVSEIFLTGLAQEAALELLDLEARQRNAQSLTHASGTLRKRIYTVTGGMPLALKLIVSQYGLGVALDEELARLEKADDEEQMYRFIYFTLWQKISEEAQMILAGAAGFGSSALYTMLLEVSELSEGEFKLALPELQRASLIEVLRHPEQAKQRYEIHAITRWFVNSTIAELWKKQDVDDE